MFNNMEDFNAALSQSMFIAGALGSLEDKLYWAAGTSIGQSWMFLSENGEYPVELLRLREMLNDQFAQASIGVVHLSNEYKAIINQMVEKLFSPDVLKAQFMAIAQMTEMLNNDEEGE